MRDLQADRSGKNSLTGIDIDFASDAAILSTPTALPDMTTDGFFDDIMSLTASSTEAPDSSLCPTIANIISYLSWRKGLLLMYFVKRDVPLADMIWAWKKNPDNHLDLQAEITRHFIRVAEANKYDLITTPRPSAGRNPETYPLYSLADAVAEAIGAKHVISFKQNKNKNQHGSFASIKQPPVELTAKYTGKSVLLIDDVFNTGTTIRMHRDALIEAGNHVDCCVFMNYDVGRNG